MVNHAKERLSERYHMKQVAFKDAYRKAIVMKNYLIGNNKEDGRVTILFSSNRHYLHKAVLSKKDGAIITVLPVNDLDFKLAHYEGIIDRK